MGYRSDTHYELHFETEEKLRNFVAVTLLLPDKFTYESVLRNEEGYAYTLKDALGECQFDAETHSIQFTSYGKWYEDFPDVQAHVMLMTLAHDKFDASTVFLRIGEATNDVEEDRYEANWDEGGATWEVYIERTVHTNLGHGIQLCEFTAGDKQT